MSVFSSKVKQHALSIVQSDVLGGSADTETANQALRLLQRHHFSNEELREYYEAFKMLCGNDKNEISAESLREFYDTSDVDLSSADCALALTRFSNKNVEAIDFETFVDRFRVLSLEEDVANQAIKLAFSIFGDEDAPIGTDDVKSLLYCIGSPRLSKEEIEDLTDAANSL